MPYNFEDLLLNLHDGAYLVDRERRIFFWNKSAEEITGYPADAVLGSRCSDNILVHVDEQGNQLCLGQCLVANCIEEGRTHQAEVFLRHREGHRIPVSVRASPLRDTEGNIVGAVELFTDISHKFAMRTRLQELEEIALTDRLTGLSNRARIETEIESRIQESHRYSLSSGVLFLDIDHFKSFNDRFGHDAGDRALKAVASTLRASARAFDVFGRWGGEEFVGIIRNVEKEELAHIAGRCRALVESSAIATSNGRERVTVSIGATLIRPEDTVETLIRRVDELMYCSKRAGRNRVTNDWDPCPPDDAAGI
jgi:diguanylate cyclase (GGDEF)-like protein/PAS domain S-box-containing protein